MLAVFLGTVVGLMMGLTGAGSVMAVPLMMWGLGWTQAEAVPVALLSVCVSACAVTALTFDVRLVRYKAAMLMAACGVPAITLGLRAAQRLPEALLNALLVAALAFVAVRMLRGSHPPAARNALVRLDPATGRIAWTPAAAGTIGACGAATGGLSGVLGTGGGFFLTPSLLSVTDLPMHSVVATTLMAVALISASGLAALALDGHVLPWAIALPFLAGTLGGMYAGRRVAARIKGPTLERAFAVLVIVVAVRTVIKAVSP